MTPRCGLAAAVALGIAAFAGCVTVRMTPEGPAPVAKSEPKPQPAVPPPGSGPPQLVVLVSIAGLMPRAYLETGGRRATMPFLAERAAEGALAERVESVAPAARLPAHATLLTGRLPSHHGVTGELVLRAEGASDPTPVDTVAPHGATLLSVARSRGLRTAALGWPASFGLPADYFFPEEFPTAVAGWPALLDSSTTPALLEPAHRLGASSRSVAVASAERDAVLVGLACAMLSSSAPPSLLLVHLSQTWPAVRDEGPASSQAHDALAATDAELRRLVGCVESSAAGHSAAIFVVGDHGVVDMHSVLEPNVALAEVGLLVPSPGVPGVTTRWSAYVRPSGGAAFVYARKEEDAVLARRALGEAAAQTGAFRIVSAEEMLRSGADPEAWFGLEATLGYEFGAAVSVPLLHAAAERAGAGYFPHHVVMAPGFVAFGAGVRPHVRIPRMRQIDVAPTVAALLGLSLEDPAAEKSKMPDGRPLVGALNFSAASAPAGR
ncbi:MAG TPA: alkaline phosphatase family protein [Myxococcota bacterium]|nr:alkaline phosphatase family protein [Myxococcota bacterium]